MIHSVRVWGSMRPHTGGDETVEIEGATVGDLLRNLVTAYPGLEEHAKQGIAVSIDGVIYNSSHNQPVPKGSEIYLLPQLKGG